MMNWHEYFMTIAHAVKLRSKDPKTQVGCIIVNHDNHIIATGYNGCTPGFPEPPSLWNSEEKHEYVIHAEINALLHATTPVKGGILYTTMFPCSHCGKAIASAGISKVFYQDTKYYNDVTVKIFKEAGIGLTHIGG